MTKHFRESPKGIVNARVGPGETLGRPIPLVVGIDPGLNGGALATSDQRLIKMPKTIAGIWDALHALVLEDPNVQFVVEDVGAPRKGNSMQSAGTFARHRGHLEMALYGLGVARQVQWPSPMTWMKFIDPPNSWPHGNNSKIVAARKNFFNDRAHALFPGWEFPKYGGDAVCILHYGQQNL